MEWDIASQAIFSCVDSAITGLKRLKWLTLEEYEQIHAIIQKAIENKENKS